MEIEDSISHLASLSSSQTSKDPLVRKSFIGPKIIGPKKCVIGPTAHRSENVALVRKPIANCVAVKVIIYWYCFV